MPVLMTSDGRTNNPPVSVQCYSQFVYVGCLNGLPLENTRATMIQLIVPKNHIVVFSKLAKVLLLLDFSGTCGDVLMAEMLSFLIGQALQRKPKEPMESSEHICICRSPCKQLSPLWKRRHKNKGKIKADRCIILHV